MSRLFIERALQRTIRLGAVSDLRRYCVMPIVLTLAVAQTCLAFEARFYPSFPNRDPLHAEVFAALAKASVTIECLGADEIDVSIGEYCKERGSYKPIYFTKNQIYLFLKKQKDKRLLAVWFLKPIMNLSNVKIQEILNDYKAFLADLGYERVLILGAAASGVYVVYDSEQAVPLSKIEGNKLQNKE